MKDTNYRKININDYIVYSYGFTKPMIGYVTALYKNGVRVSYVEPRFTYQVDPPELVDRLTTTICKKIEHIIVVTDLIENETFREIFNANKLLEFVGNYC